MNSASAPVRKSLLGTLAVLLLASAACHAQVRPGRVGVGAWAGNQSGLVVKYYAGRTTAYEVLISRDGDQIAGLNAHLLHEAALPRSPLTFFVGLGGFVGLLDTEDAHLTFGPSSNAGLNFFSHHFEVFLQGMPHLQLSPDVDARLGLGAGLRYYF